MSVTAPAGFRAAGVAAGIKASGGLDLALVVNEGPSDVAAAVFTTNRVKAAPVQWSEQVIADRRLRAVVLNSGGANACTGPDGFADTHRTAEAVAAALGVGAGDVAVCSTGLIGERLPMPAVLGGIDAAAAALSEHGGADAAEAIRTTDTVHKQAYVTRSGWTVGGMAKGAGMLAPGLATMLCVLTTDADLDAAVADQALRAATGRTFDRIDADGCMSTNDTVVLLASGASGCRPTLPSSPRRCRRCAPIWRASCSPMPRARPRRFASRSSALQRGRRGRGRAEHRPQQPAQMRPVRQRPQLGTRAGGHRHHPRGLRSRPARRRHERRADLPQRRSR